jgi:drug/metabolite transporter (DMT)-like permease
MEQPACVADAASRARGQTNVRAVGLTMAAIATITAAVQPVLVRYGASRIDPTLFAAGCAVVAALSVFPVLQLRGELRILVDRRYRLRLMGVAMAGTVVTTLSLVYGFRHIDAVAGILLLQSEPVYSLLLASLFAGERPKPRQIAATLIIVAGIASAVGPGGVYSPGWAAALLALTPLSWQTAHILSLPVMPPLSPVCITGARYGYGAVVLAIGLIALNPGALAQLADPTVLIIIIAAGTICYFLGSLTWYAAINRLSLAWTTALVIPGVPLLSIAFAIIFLGERATTRELAGVVVSIAGMLLLVLGADGIRQGAVASVEAVHHPIN